MIVVCLHDDVSSWQEERRAKVLLGDENDHLEDDETCEEVYPWSGLNIQDILRTR